MDLIDLHTHTTMSDGSLSPGELVRAADAAGLKAVAITDHDTVAGLGQALAAGQGLAMEVVPGVEISLETDFPGGMHLVGLYLDHGNQGLAQGLAGLQEARVRRNPRMVERLNELGIPVTMAEVEAVAGGGLVGRPHFALALVRRGVVSTTGEAFSRYLRPGCPAYVPKDRLAPAEGIRLVRAAGGLPVLAHPGLLPVRGLELERLCRELKGLGLEGLEAYYPQHGRAATNEFIRLAARLGLVVSGGSDFHGAPKPELALGRGDGKLMVPATILTGIKQRAARIKEEEA